MDIQLSLAQVASVLRSQGHGFSHQVVIVFHRHRQGAFDVGFHTAGYLGSVGECHLHRLSHSQVRLALHLHRHFIIQRQHRQCAMLQHHIRHIVPFLGIENLHHTGRKGRYRLGSRFVAGSGNLLRQVIQGFLDLGNGAHHTNRVHLGNGVPLGHHIPVFHQIPGQLHILRDGQRHSPLPGELTAADDLGLNILPLHLGRKDAGLGRIRPCFSGGCHG